MYLGSLCHCTMQVDDSVLQVWDVNCHYEQMEAFNYAVRSSCELAFEKVGSLFCHGYSCMYVHLSVHRCVFFFIVSDFPKSMFLMT